MPVEDSVAPLRDEMVVFAGSLFAMNLLFCLRVGCLLCLGELSCSQFPTIIEWYGKISSQSRTFYPKILAPTTRSPRNEHQTWPHDYGVRQMDRLG